jgi:hypothetical protein
MNFILVNDPGSHSQRLIRSEHISVIEVSKTDESVTLLLTGGQEVHLSHEESKQLVHHVKQHMHPGKAS